MIKHSKEAYKLLHDGALTLSKIEQQGLRIDTDYIARKKESITNDINMLESKFYDTDFYYDWNVSKKGKVNIHSPTQLSYFLYNVKKLKIPKETKSGQGSTDEESLNRLGIPELDILLRIKKLKKIRDTYLDPFERETTDGYIHPFYNLHNVRSMRSSSDRPNFQNIPIRDEESMNTVRGAVFPRPGHQLLEVDYSQLEVRIAACYCKDEKLMSDIIEGDMHRDMAVEIFKLDKFDKSLNHHSILRKAAKNGFVFPQFYGDYYGNCAEYLAIEWCKLPQSRWKPGQGIEFGEGKTISDHLISKGIRSYTTFERHLKNIEYNFWEKRYYRYDQWRSDWWERYQMRGYMYCKTGFVFQGLMSKNEVLNYPIQGSAFHCLLWSLIEAMKAQRRERWDTKIVGQIHDSMLLDVNPKELKMVLNILKCIMCSDIKNHWPWIIVPLDIEADVSPVDASWAEKEAYEF